MQINYRNRRLEKMCCQQKTARKKLGQRCGDLLLRRRQEIEAAETLAILRQVHPRTHELAGRLKGIISLDLEHPFRLLIRPDNDPVPLLEDGGLDWAAVTIVQIWEVEDTHG